MFVEKGDEIKGIITGIGDIIEWIWNRLKPIIDAIIPILKAAFTFIGNLLAGIVGNVIGVISLLVYLPVIGRECGMVLVRYSQVFGI